MLKQIKNSSFSFPRNWESIIKKLDSCFCTLGGTSRNDGIILQIRREFLKILFPVIFCILISACSSDIVAPVASIGAPPIPAAGVYHVKAGDTLYSIAWAYAMDYRQLAELNHLTPPYNLETGQAIYLRNAAPANAASMPVAAPRPVPVTQQEAPRPAVALGPVYRWLWPVRGRLREGFSAGYGGNPGIDISGRAGTPIRATAAGIVVYSGTGVKSYGNLIIIKHNDSYLSAYAYNKRNLVRQGAVVRAGQVIALLGRNNAGVALLHFEIRRDGQPVNPLRYLQ